MVPVNANGTIPPDAGALYVSPESKLIGSVIVGVGVSVGVTLSDGDILGLTLTDGVGDVTAV